jgi:YVTN family beta-propeller protein
VHRFILSGLVALVVVLLGVTGVGADAPTLPASGPVIIPVGSSPGAVAVNPTTDTIYVANNGSNTVSMIDGATDTVTATIAVGTSPYSVAVDPLTNTIYVANFGSRTVSVIDGATNTVTQTVGSGAGVGNDPSGVAVDPRTNRLYVTNYVDGTVSVFR